MTRFLPGIVLTLLIEALLVVSFVIYQIASNPQLPGCLGGPGPTCQWYVDHPGTTIPPDYQAP